ncbi:Ribosomal-protein-alanine acetyltransferase [Chlamydiales bacterium STE3]|nr:Ribosomal-protein-alanine acetyltransferase [Chlamydiales bacterium STE3]
MIEELHTSNLVLNSLCEADFAAILHFEKRNERHLKKWQTSSNFTQEKLEAWLKEYQEERSIRLLLRLKTNSDIIGFCNFTQIFRGPFQACYLGYKIDYVFEGKGLMHEALQAAIKAIFEEAHLHRIMANYMPSNKRSETLLRRLGFSKEGFAKNYLLINGRWEDHILTALTYEQWKIFKR